MSRQRSRLTEYAGNHFNSLSEYLSYIVANQQKFKEDLKAASKSNKKESKFYMPKSKYTRRIKNKNQQIKRKTTMKSIKTIKTKKTLK
tara:strand:- start:1573 stop:1836 length:264 start_codon:yes stop_codon:yes gene_type:complete